MKYTAVLAAAALAGAANANDVCRALVLSGGGNNGSWEVGALYGLLHNGNEADFAYDVITGVSAGAINTMAMAGYPIGKEKEMSEFMSDLWKNLKTEDVWKDWPLGKVSGVTIMDGAVDNSPLLNFLEKTLTVFKDGYQRRVTLATANVETGEYTQLDQTNLDFQDLPKAAVSSASIPFIFPPFKWKNKGIFMDGGTIFNINVEGAVHQCLDLVDDESKIIVDVFICGAGDDEEIWEKVGRTSWTNYFRGRSVRKFYGNTSSLAYSMAAHPKIDLRYVIKQADASYMGGLSELNFDGDFTWPAQEQGRADAIAALNGDASVNVKDMFVEWLDDATLQEEFP